MAQLALGAVGAAVGFAIGGPLGASIGWSLGAVAGAALFARGPDVQGARVTSFRPSESAYGNTLPVIYGGSRLGGQLNWEGVVYERANKTGSRKRGFVTEYRYEQSFRMDFCAGPVQAFPRVWFDSKLVFGGNMDTVAEALQVGSFIEKATFHYGTDTEAADPLAQAEARDADEPASDVPGYRNVAGISWERLDLTEWGNRKPAVNAEVVEFGTMGVPNLIAAVDFPSFNGAPQEDDPNLIESTIWPLGDGDDPDSFLENRSLWDRLQFDVGDDAVLAVGSQVKPWVYFMRSGGFTAAHLWTDGEGGPVLPNGDQKLFDLEIISPYPAQISNLPQLSFGILTGYSNPGTVYFATGVWMVRSLDPDSGLQYNAIGLIPASHHYACIDHGTAAWDPDGSGSGWIYCLGREDPVDSGSAVTLRRYRFHTSEQDVAGAHAQSSWPRKSDPSTGDPLPMPFRFINVLDTADVLLDLSTLSGYGSGGSAWVGVDEVDIAAGRHRVYFRWTGMSDQSLFMLDTAEPVGIGNPKRITSVDETYPWALAVWDGQLLLGEGSLDVTFPIKQYRLSEDRDALTLMGTGTADLGTHDGGGPRFVNMGDGVVFTQWESWTMSPRVTQTGRTLDEVVTLICAGVIEEEDLDVSDVTGILVRGFALERRATRRSMLEPLLQAYGCIGFVSEGKLKVRRRNQSPSGTIAYAELGAMREAGDTDTPAYAATRERTSTLPQRVDVTYADVDDSYLPGNQIATRGQVVSEESVTVALPVAMTKAEAAQAAWRILSNAWAERTETEITTDMRHAHREPGDVVYLEDETGQAAQVEIVRRAIDDGIVTFTLRSADSGTYVQVSEGASGPTTPGMAMPPPRTSPVVLEVPALIDSHGLAATIYVAGHTYAPDRWRSGTVFRSNLDDTGLAPIEDLHTVHLGGVSLTALPAFDADRTAQYDLSTFDATIAGGAPDAVSISEQLAGSGLMAVGGELVRYRTATSLGDGAYRFHGIQRAAYGTDYAQAHEGGEQVLIIPDVEELNAIGQQLTDIGATRRWRTVTGGLNALAAPSTVHSLTGRTLRPLAPVHLTLTVGASDARVISWIRRSRVYQDLWLTGVDVPNSEQTETYSLEILDDDGATLRTATVTDAQTWSYTAAMRLADYGEVEPSTITVRVAQVSALVGNGDWAERTLENSGIGLLVLHLAFEGTDGSTTITDSEGRHTPTATGGAEIDTARAAIGSASLLCDGAGKYVTVPNSADFYFAGDNFDITVYDYPTSGSGNAAIATYAKSPGTTNTDYAWQIYRSSTSLVAAIYSGSTGYGASGVGTLTTNAWNKIRFYRRGNYLYREINDVAVGSPVDVTGVTMNNPAGAVLRVGEVFTFYPHAGSIDDLKVRRYT